MPIAFEANEWSECLGPSRWGVNRHPFPRHGQNYTRAFLCTASREAFFAKLEVLGGQEKARNLTKEDRRFFLNRGDTVTELKRN